MENEDNKNLEDTLNLDEVSNELNQIMNDNNEDNVLEMQLHILEAAYIKESGYDILSNEASSLFPKTWSDPGNYYQKINALSEAMEENKKIEETRAYQSLNEGVKKY